MVESTILKAQKNKITIRKITNRHLPISQGKIKKLIPKILKCLKTYGDWSIGVVFLSDKRIQTLNKKYLKHNYPTDVISFNYSKNSADIVISLDMVKRNAKTYKTSPKEELLLYLIHGVLHLLGYEDTTPAKKSRMFRKQEQIFAKLKGGSLLGL